VRHLYSQQIDRGRSRSRGGFAAVREIAGECSRSRGGFAAVREVAICMVSKLIADVRGVAGVARQFARSRGNGGVQKDAGAFIGDSSF
jgi:hypothetical protein